MIVFIVMSSHVHVYTSSVSFYPSPNSSQSHKASELVGLSFVLDMYAINIILACHSVPNHEDQ